MILTLVGLLFVVGEWEAGCVQLCDCVGRMEGFQMDKYLGRWYELESRGNIWEQNMFNCPTADYTLDGDVVIVENTGTLKKSGNVVKVKGTGKPDGEAKLLVQFTIKGVRSPTAPYCILKTDYKTWAVVWTCMGVKDAYLDSMYILGRSKEPLSQEDVSAVAEVFKAHNLNRTNFKVIDHSKCNV